MGKTDEDKDGLREAGAFGPKGELGALRGRGTEWQRGRAECQPLEAAGRGHSPKLPSRSNQRGKRLEASHKKRVSKICPLMHSLIYSVRLGSF